MSLLPPTVLSQSGFFFSFSFYCLHNSWKWRIITNSLKLNSEGTGHFHSFFPFISTFPSSFSNNFHAKAPIYFLCLEGE